MKLNQKFIQQLRNGEIAAENNGTAEQLREVIKAAFPKIYSFMGGYRFYFKDIIHKNEWNAADSTSLPIISVTAFYQPELFTGWAKDDRFPEWMVYFKDEIAQYGFDGCEYEWILGVRMYISRYSEIEDNRPATHEEVEQGLSEEANKRGYKKGVTCFHASENYKTTLASNDIEYFISRKGYGVLVMGGYTIFSEKDGQWAEIIEKPQPKTNPIHYTVGGTTYSLNYQELKAEYENAVNLTDESFMKYLPQIAHLACIVAYFKGLGVQATISDKGIIHELIHLMTEPNEPTNDLQEIREKFNKLIQLV